MGITLHPIITPVNHKVMGWQ